MRSTRYVLIGLVIAGLLFSAFGVGFAAHWYVSSERAQPSEDDGRSLSVFWEAWNILEDEFLGEEPGAIERAYGAAHGMVATYQDPYTLFVEPEPRELERDDMRGHFGGIGAWVSANEEGQLVLTPMSDSPAEAAGVLEGDILVAVDGQPVDEMSGDEAVALIRGPVGSEVLLTLLRMGTGETLDVSVTRDRVELPTVEYRLLDEPRIGYVAIRLIGERTPVELEEAIADLGEQGASRLILDLRHNPGGAPPASVDVAGQFLSGSVVLYEQRKDGQEKPYYASRGGSALDWPLVVLVDGGSASGSEIIAGSLQAQGRAELVGEKTFGKGSVQHVHDLSDGSSLHVTVARWLTPHKAQIDKIGLIPDHIISVTQEDVNAGRDPPLEQAMALLGS